MQSGNALIVFAVGERSMTGSQNPNAAMIGSAGEGATELQALAQKQITTEARASVVIKSRSGRAAAPSKLRFA
jgi:hypothetical protein